MLELIPWELDRLFEDTDCKLKVYGLESQLVQTIQLRSARISLGYGLFTSPTNKFFHLSYGYKPDNSKACTILDIWSVSATSGTKESTFTFGSNFSCSNLEWALSYISGSEYRLVLSDLTNYTNVRVYSIQPTGITLIQDFDWSPIDYSPGEIYWKSSTNILISETVGFDQNKIGIRITNLAQDQLVGNPIIFKLINQTASAGLELEQSSNRHTHKYTTPTEIPSKILQIRNNLYLIKIKYDVSINPLKVETKCIVVLVDFESNKILDSKPYDKEKKLAYDIELNLNTALPEVSCSTALPEVSCSTALPKPSIGFFKLSS